jgi:type IV pilus assembly protein PilM
MPATPSLLKAEISAESLKKLIPSRSRKSPQGQQRTGRKRASATLVGLDIQPGYVSAVQARVNGSVAVQRAVGAPLPADTVREGEVIDAHALSETLRELFQGKHLDRRVRVGIANQRTVLRTLELPPITDGKELATAIRFQAEDQIPMPLDSAVLDYQTLGIVDTPAGPRQRVIVVAAQRDMVERLIAAVRGAGLRPEGIDLSAFALIRALHRADEQHEGRVLYLNVDGLTNMAIAEGTACRFTRVAAGGLESMATDIASRHAIPLDRARELLAAVDLGTVAPAPAIATAAPAQTPEAPETSEAPDAAAAPTAEAMSQTAFFQSSPEAGAEASAEEQTPATLPLGEVGPTPPSEPEIDVRPVLVAGVREIAGEVRNSLDYHRSQESGGEVSTIVLSGAALQIAGFAEALRSELSVPIVTQTVDFGGAGVAGSVSPERLAVAAGLSVEEAPR